MSEKVLIIGSAGSGQTSLLKHLTAAGYECMKGNAYSDAYDVSHVVCCYKLTPDSIKFLKDNMGKVPDKKRCVAVLNTVTDANFEPLEGALTSIPQVKVSCQSGEGLEGLISVLHGEVPPSSKAPVPRPQERDYSSEYDPVPPKKHREEIEENYYQQYDAQPQKKSRYDADRDYYDEPAEYKPKKASSAAQQHYSYDDEPVRA